MGSVLQAKCSCGFESDELFLGGGMMDMGAICNIPYYCDHCEIVGTINILKKNTDELLHRELKKDIKCKKCRRKIQYYGEISEDNFESQEDYAFDWSFGFDKRYLLHDKLYHCPKCKKEKMKFYMTACWD